MKSVVELFEQDIKTNDRQSSKGNQLKWENQGIWYKADYAGYEGLAEYVISQLLVQSALSETEYVLYEQEEIQYKSMIYQGVKSNSFLQDGWQLITLERLFQNHFGRSFYTSIFSIADHENRLRFLVEQTERITGLKDFGIYLNKMFTIDAFFLNEDRHLHNIAVLMNGKGDFAYCPIFDNGAGLLSDIQMDYPLNGDVYELMKTSQSKTICGDFDEQLELSEKLYGNNITFNFTGRDIDTLLKGASGYPENVLQRVEDILREQMRKYQYLFK